MRVTAFNARLGSSQGRLNALEQTGSVAPLGEYVFVLGDLEPGHLHELAHGDYAEVQQAVDLTSAHLVRAQLRLRVPESTPSGWRWVVSVCVDGAPLAQASCQGGRERALTDLAANVSKLVGTHTVALRLSVEEG